MPKTIVVTGKATVKTMCETENATSSSEDIIKNDAHFDSRLMHISYELLKSKNTSQVCLRVNISSLKEKILNRNVRVKNCGKLLTFAESFEKIRLKGDIFDMMTL